MPERRKKKGSRRFKKKNSRVGRLGCENREVKRGGDRLSLHEREREKGFHSPPGGGGGAAPVFAERKRADHWRR